MNRPFMVWSPGSQQTRVMVTRGQEILLKAQLGPGPAHPRAPQWLMEAIALWEGSPIRAVIAADESGATCGRAFWDAVGMDFGGALYSLRLAACEPRPARQLSLLHDLVPEVKGFCDLEQTRIAEALAGEQ